MKRRQKMRTEQKWSAMSIALFLAAWHSECFYERERHCEFIWLSFMTSELKYGKKGKKTSESDSIA